LNWLKHLFVLWVTIFAFVWLTSLGGYYAAFGQLLIIPLAPLILTLIARRLVEAEIFQPAELLLWISVGCSKFLAFWPRNPWAYGIRYALDELAVLCLHCERFTESEEYARESLTLRKDERSASTPKLMLTLTEALRLQSKLLASEEYAMKSLDLCEAVARGYVPGTWMLPLRARAHNQLSLIKLEQGLYREAEDAARDGLQILTDTPVNINLSAYELVREYCLILNCLGYAALAHGQMEEALSKFKQVENIARKAFVRTNELQVKAIIDSALAEMGLEQLDAAEKSLDQAKQMMEKAKYSTSLQGDLDYTLGLFKLHRKALGEAEKLFLSALAKREKIYGTLHPQLAEICLGLARTKFELGQSAEAKLWLERTIDIYYAQEVPNKDKIDSAWSLSRLWSGQLAHAMGKKTSPQMLDVKGASYGQ
jgi:tetratricopeptide (TPR) repeat protein